MLVAFDAHMLIWAFDDGVTASFIGPQGEVGMVRERVRTLLEDLTTGGHNVIVPAPALAEFLVKVPPADQSQFLAKLSKAAAIRVEPFDAPAASETARLIAGQLAKGKLGAGHPGGRAAIKFDIQIVAIAAVLGVDTIYSSDSGVRKLAAEVGIQTLGIWEIQPRFEQVTLF